MILYIYIPMLDYAMVSFSSHRNATTVPDVEMRASIFFFLNFSAKLSELICIVNRNNRLRFYFKCF